MSRSRCNSWGDPVVSGHTTGIREWRLAEKHPFPIPSSPRKLAVAKAAKQSRYAFTRVGSVAPVHATTPALACPACRLETPEYCHVGRIGRASSAHGNAWTRSRIGGDMEDQPRSHCVNAVACRSKRPLAERLPHAQCYLRCNLRRGWARSSTSAISGSPARHAGQGHMSGAHE